MKQKTEKCPFCGGVMTPIYNAIYGNRKYNTIRSWECSRAGCQFNPDYFGSQELEHRNLKKIMKMQARIDELEKQVEWHLFDIDNVNTYPPCADMYLTLSIPERTEYREIDDEETYDVLWFELYSEEYWHKHNVTHWAYLPAPPQEEE